MDVSESDELLRVQSRVAALANAEIKALQRCWHFREGEAIAQRLLQMREERRETVQQGRGI
jgi:hypothetical protein